ncbi:MAG: thrombospondin type 3 repeat-containing protein [Patescibacteria group bacterium]
MKYLPSKKLIISAIILFGIIGGGFWFLKNKPLVLKKTPKTSTLSQKDIKKLLASDQDSDADGLKDWEEVLWGANPNKADTDADGTADGKEIEQNRNPLIAGPEDSLSLSASRVAPETALDKPLSLTEQIGREFLTNYLTFKKSGERVDSYTQADLIKAMLNGLKTQEFENIYSLKDLFLNPKTDQKAIEEYAGELEKIFEKNFNPLKENELAILQSAVEFGAEKPEVLEKLKPYELAYKNSAEELLKINSPAAYAQIHLNFINGLAKTEKSVAAFQQLFIDPAQAIQGLKWYQEEEKNLIANFQELRKKLLVDGVKLAAPGQGLIVIRNHQ